MKNILVLTHTNDDTASMVIDHLSKLDCLPIRFDTDNFNKDIKVNMKMSETGSFDFYYKTNKYFGLTFSAFDFIITKDDRLVF